MKLSKMTRDELQAKCIELDLPMGDVETRPSDAEMRERIATKLASLGVKVEDEAKDPKGKIVSPGKIDTTSPKDTIAVLHAERQVKIRILRTERSGDAVPVSINGHQYVLQTGIDIDVPVSVAKVLQNAVEWKFNPANPRLPPREERSYPFDIVDGL